MRIGHALHASLALTALAAAAPAVAQSLPNRIDGAIAQNGAPRAASRGTILRTIMTTGISVKFDQTKAKEAFAYVRQLLGIDIVVRWSNDPGASDGLDPEMPLTFEMNNAQALVVLERMIEMSTTEPATWQLRQSYLEVGTKARLNTRGAQETRIYPIRDLLFEAPNFDNAPEFNLNQAVQSGSSGGGGGGSGGGGGGFGGGGGGGGSGGGGGGGSPFGTPGESPARRSAEEKGDQLVELIKSLVEPDVWLDDSVASIRYYDGSIIVRAPDYVQREIAGYGWLSGPPPAKRTGGRYVDVSAPIGVSKVTGFGTSTVTGATGGGGFGGTGSGAGGAGGAGSPIPGGSTSAAPSGSGNGAGNGTGNGTGRKGTSSSTGSGPGSGSGAGNSAALSGATPPANAPGSGTKP